jgi:hypothetical protein
MPWFPDFVGPAGRHNKSLRAARPAGGGRWDDEQESAPHQAATSMSELFILRSGCINQGASPARYQTHMTEHNPYDQRVHSVKQRLHDELVDANGHPADPNDVDRVVDAKAESLADAPVQEFVPLLIEHQARDELRAHGLHRELGDTEATSGLGEAANEPANESS